ncbi:MAG: hypothetical protein PF572_02750 [Patescibacteria group bacterium]|nr:hypothetical protein [Patescibacteria group bacterium]
MMELLEITAKAAGFPDPKSIPEIIGALIGIVLSFVGIIFLCLTIYGGFLWMTSGGNEVKILKAKETLRNSIIGLIIILSAYSVARFVTGAIISSTL